MKIVIQSDTEEHRETQRLPVVTKKSLWPSVNPPSFATSFAEGTEVKESYGWQSWISSE